jgi:DNA-binding transcriptional LysR family regulator
MDIDELKTFLEVYHTRHFGQAAENLYISQSTVSARIRLLEQNLGVALFTRERNNIQLTGAGKKLLNYAESILTTWTRARFEIGSEEEGQTPFIFGGVPSLWDINLQYFLNYLHETLPDIAIYAETHSADIFLRRIHEKTMDMAFIFDAPQTADLEVVEVTHVPLVMVSSYKGMSINDVFTKEYVIVDWGTSFSTSHARFFRDAPSPSIRISLGRIAKNYIISQGGTAYLPEPMISEQVEKGILHYVKDAPVIDRIAYAVFNSSNLKQDLLKHALNFFNLENEKVHRIY